MKVLFTDSLKALITNGHPSVAWTQDIAALYFFQEDDPIFKPDSEAWYRLQQDGFIRALDRCDFYLEMVSLRISPHTVSA